MTLIWSLGAGAAAAKDIEVKLTGAEETPRVTTSAAGAGKISIAKDHTVKGSIKTTGIEGIAARIHAGASGQCRSQARRDPGQLKN